MLQRRQTMGQQVRRERVANDAALTNSCADSVLERSSKVIALVRRMLLSAAGALTGGFRDSI
jgi:hypothetical protein